MRRALNIVRASEGSNEQHGLLIAPCDRAAKQSVSEKKIWGGWGGKLAIGQRLASGTRRGLRRDNILPVIGRGKDGVTQDRFMGFIGEGVDCPSGNAHQITHF